MPKVICSHCGEELMGSVNRCWRCGRTFVAEHNPDNLPPIRRRPIPLELVNQSFEELALAAAARQPVGAAASTQLQSAGDAVVAELVEGTAAADAQQGAQPSTGREGEGDAHHQPVAMPVAPPPAIGAGSTPPARTTPYYAPPVTPTYPSNAGATGGAIASIVLGVMALATIKFITPGALLISILGVGMGVWGLYSDRRTAAVLGLLLCCLAMSISGFLSAVQLFELINGYNPFEGDLPPVDSTAL
jgi:hypothetical protein